MTNVIKNSFSTESLLLDEIRMICVMNATEAMAQKIIDKIDNAAIPMQMDQDLMRRLSEPACNPHDINFDMPHSLLNKDYSQPQKFQS